jgi:hypothetical protein
MNKQNKPQKKRRQTYDNLKISRELRDIIHGYIMSDGYVKEAGNLTVEQSKKQEKFVQWLYNKFEPIRTSTPISTVHRIDKRTNTETSSLRFNTRNVLHGFHSMWYKALRTHKNEFRKGLPKNIHCFFSPVFITLWFAGDGTKILGSIGAKLEVTAFTPKERQVLKELFKTKYNISVSINRAGVTKKGKEQWTICINSAEYHKFKALITQIDLIPTLFPYKLH